MHTIIWRFTVKPEAVTEFENHYRADGAWAALFNRAPGYRGTDLLRDVGQPLVFVTIDRWETAAAFAAFKAAHASAYAALDAQCEKLTVGEEKLAAFDS